MSLKRRIAVSALSLSVAGLAAIAGYEGFSDTVYIPVPGDVPTAGFGHTDPSMQIGDKITRKQAEEWLREDASAGARAVKKCVHVPLSQTEFDVYTSFAFNIGVGAFCNSTLVKRLNSGDYASACSELRRWVYVKGRRVQGLVNRRESEYRRCMGLTSK